LSSLKEEPMDFEKLVEHFDHYDFDLAQDPHPCYRYLRERCPLARSDRHDGFWVVSTYEDVHTVMSDSETYSTKTLTIPEPENGLLFPVSQTDPPEHAEWRAIIQPWLSAGRIAKSEASVRQRTNELIDEFVERGACDLALDLGYKLPADVIADIMGVPREDETIFRDCANRLSDTNIEDPEGARAAFQELFEYYGKLLDQRRHEPRDDIPTVLVNATVEGRPLTFEELVMLCIIIQLGGFATTAGFIANVLWHLAEHPEHRERLLDEPSVIPRAIEEYLRAFAPASVGRRVTRDTVLRDMPLKQGDRLILLLGSANRDDDVFPNADVIDFDRSPNRHVAFGQSIHRCVGMHLARLEAKVLLEEVLLRIPDFHVTPGTRPRLAVGHNWGVRSLPVTFTPGQRTAPLVG
jgi:cytochrome P450